MKKFLLGLVIVIILGTVVIIVVGQPRGPVGILTSITSNPISLWCNKLVDGAKEFGNVEVAVTKNSQLVSDLVVLLSKEKPPMVPYPGDSSGRTLVPFPQKACFSNTNAKGAARFKDVPVGTAYLFFNNDVAAYPKKFGSPNPLITPIEVKQGETISVAIELSREK